MKQPMKLHNLFRYVNMSGVIESTDNFASKLAHMAKIEIDEIESTAATVTVLRLGRVSVYLWNRFFTCIIYIHLYLYEI